MKNQETFKLIKSLREYDDYLYNTLKHHENNDSVGHALGYITDSLINDILGTRDYVATWLKARNDKGYLADQAYAAAEEADTYKDFKLAILDLEEDFLSFK